MQMNWKIVSTLTLILLATQALGDGSKDWDATCTLLEGGSVTVRSLTITRERITGTGAPADLVLDDLRSIELPTEFHYLVRNSPPGEMGIAQVELHDGNRLRTKKISISNEIVRLEWLG